MPDVTPIYNWPIPEDTDLVKDGAKNIRDLADAVETTVSSVPTGLVHIETQSLDGLASLSLNNIFSADYDNYRIILFTNATSENNTTNIRLRASGSDLTTSSYLRQFIIGRGATASADESTGTVLQIGTTQNSSQCGFFGEIVNPYLARTTTIIGYSETGSGAQTGVELRRARVEDTSIYDGITILVVSGTISTGSVSIYGYSKG